MHLKLFLLGQFMIPVVLGRTKRGLAYNETFNPSLVKSGSSVSWEYNWDTKPFGEQPPGIEFVPMIRNNVNLNSVVKALPSNESHYLLGFNEPDLQNFSSASDAAKSFFCWITPLHKHWKLISPAVSSSAAPNQGLLWLSQFLDLCSDCKLTGIAIHWYGKRVADFQDHVRSAIKLATKHHIQEVWVTEFGLDDEMTEIKNPINTAECFMKDAISWLDNQPIITRYAYFMWGRNFLLTPDGLTINQAGEKYIQGS